MRALVDTNIFVSYLLHTGSPAPPSSIVRAALAGRFRIVIPHATFDELQLIVASKPYLTARIPEALVNSLIELLMEGGGILPPSLEPLPRITRDPGDDFMVTQAVLEGIDYLVTGDKDLLVLGELAGVRVVSPAEFVNILDAETGS